VALEARVEAPNNRARVVKADLTLFYLQFLVKLIFFDLSTADEAAIGHPQDISVVFKKDVLEGVLLIILIRSEVLDDDLLPIWVIQVHDYNTVVVLFPFWRFVDQGI
jgi:hypothetical protein